MINFINKKSSSSIQLNIYSQLDEPIEKNGIWIKTDKKYNDFASVESTTNLVPVEKNYPETRVFQTAVLLNNAVYFGFNLNNGYRRDMYKYDITNNTYSFVGSNGVYGYLGGVGDCTYENSLLVRNWVSNVELIKINPSNAATIIKATLPKKRINGTMLNINGTIWFIGGNEPNSSTYQKDISEMTSFANNSCTLTKRYDLPWNFSSNTSVNIGTNIYIFKGNTIYRFNTNSYSFSTFDTISFMTSSENVVNNSVVTDGTYIYFRYNYHIYRYNVNNKEIKDLGVVNKNQGYSFLYQNNGKLYLYTFHALGMDSASDYSIDCYLIDNELHLEFENNTLVLENGTSYSTKIETEKTINGLKAYFKDLFTYNGSLQDFEDLPIYYGDGTNWINLKNEPSS